MHMVIKSHQFVLKKSHLVIATERLIFFIIKRLIFFKPVKSVLKCSFNCLYFIKILIELMSIAAPWVELLIRADYTEKRSWVHTALKLNLTFVSLHGYVAALQRTIYHLTVPDTNGLTSLIHARLLQLLWPCYKHIHFLKHLWKNQVKTTIKVLIFRVCIYNTTDSQ